MRQGACWGSCRPWPCIAAMSEGVCCGAHGGGVLWHPWWGRAVAPMGQQGQHGCCRVLWRPWRHGGGRCRALVLWPVRPMAGVPCSAVAAMAGVGVLWRPWQGVVWRPWWAHGGRVAATTPCLPSLCRAHCTMGLAAITWQHDAGGGARAVAAVDWAKAKISPIKHPTGNSALLFVVGTVCVLGGV